MAQLNLGLSARPAVLTVAELNRKLRGLLEGNFGEVWVAGEISNLRVPASGHFYFTLKDGGSQIAAVMFRGSQRGLAFRPTDGMEVIARARVSLYEARGDLQLYVEALEPKGIGALQLALEQLKEKLAAEGLFDVERKCLLPPFPRVIGLVTAQTGAVVHDMVITLRRRMPGIRIVLRPVRVQGLEAGGDIVAAIADLHRQDLVDVIIVGRGGGSLEDLWAFNEERVARAIAAATIPIVSAVGHETDFTIADLVADMRAATPTAAATLVLPDFRELRDELRVQRRTLDLHLRARLSRERQRLEALARHLRDPRQTLRQWRLRIDEFSERSARAVSGCVRQARLAMQAKAERLEALSPLAVLRRGYAIVHKSSDGQIVHAASEVKAGDEVELRFANDSARAVVK